MKRLALLTVLLLALPMVAEEKERTVSLDVKDEEVRPILASLQHQCGIRNLVVDKDVDGRGTFLFRDVPCSVAFKTVLSTFGLTYEGDPKLLQVKRR